MQCDFKKEIEIIITIHFVETENLVNKHPQCKAVFQNLVLINMKIMIMYKIDCKFLLVSYTHSTT